MSIHWQHTYLRATFLGFRAWVVIPLFISILRPFNLTIHLITLMAFLISFWIEKKEGYVMEYYWYKLRTKLGGKIRKN